MKHRLLLPCLLCPMLACDAGAEPDAEIVSRSGTMASKVNVVAQFQPELGETPESVAVGLDGKLYVSMALTGEIRRVTKSGQQSTLAVIPLGDPAQCVGPFPGIMGALAIDVFSNIYVGASSCGEIGKNVWRVTPSGNTSVVATLPPTALPNGIAVHFGHVYVADSASTTIWRAPVYGSGQPAKAWTDEPLLADPDPFDIFPGANGLQFYGDSMYVANAGAATIVEIPFHLGGLFGADFVAEEGSVRFGPPGSGAEHETPALPGCDDFAFDILGRLYCTTDPFQTLLRIDTDGQVTVLLDAEDGLDGPTAATFGRGSDRKTLYVSNAMFPFFPSTGHGPSILSLDLGVAGYPLR